jgi:apolipoprotein D and lipocalin family protein
MTRIALFAVAFVLIAGKSHAKEKPLTTVPRVDLERYLGSWYEIARYPNSFQDGCVATVATYGLRDDGDVSVHNTCREDSLDGRLKGAKARAWLVDKENQTKLKVRFFWPFAADYWIIDLAPDYSYAVVGQPSRDYLWILSRTPTLAPEVLDGIYHRLRTQDYDPSRLEFTPQPRDAAPFAVPSKLIN